MIEQAEFSNNVPPSAVSFSITADAAWAPGVETRDAWTAWAKNRFSIAVGSEPALRAMPAMQRRRVGFLGRMALEVAYDCLGNRTDVPIVFCSRHGEVSRSVDLLRDLSAEEPLSPASFGLSVHNAVAGLFSIARGDTANNIALSAGQSSIEHAVIEACGLLADGEQAVLLVAYDCPLPAIYAEYQDCNEQPYAWAWLIEPPQQDVISLAWTAAAQSDMGSVDDLPAGLQILRFHLRRDPSMDRVCSKQKWQWTRHA
jgi:hypothetical protein